MALDLKDPDLYADGVPYARLAELRAAGDVHWNPEADGPGFWSVLRHADITAVSKDPQTFSSAFANGGHRIFNEHERGTAALGANAVGIPFISTDPPEHRWYRSAVLPGLKLGRVREMVPRLEARIASLLDRVQERGDSFDFVEHIAAPYPLLTLAELIGVPDADIDRLYDWSNALVGEDDPTLRISPEQMLATMGAMLDYANHLYDARHREPGDDILSMLVHTQINGQPLARADFIATFILLLVGGNETTRNSIAHGMVAFTEHRDQWEKLRSDRSLMPAAVREIVRYASPVLHMRRTATCDTQIAGVPVARGDKVVMWYMSGNRDERAFDAPERFDIERPGPLHVGFGTGEHTCVGNRLAEVQIALMFTALLDRLPGLHITGRGRRLRSNFINGFLELPASVR